MVTRGGNTVVMVSTVRLRVNHSNFTQLHSHRPQRTEKPTDARRNARRKRKDRRTCKRDPNTSAAVELQTRKTHTPQHRRAETLESECTTQQTHGSCQMPHVSCMCSVKDSKLKGSARKRRGIGAQPSTLADWAARTASTGERESIHQGNRSAR